MSPRYGDESFLLVASLKDISDAQIARFDCGVEPLKISAKRDLGRALVRFAAEQSVRVSHITGCIGLATEPINSIALLLKLAGLEKLVEG